MSMRVGPGQGKALNGEFSKLQEQVSYFVNSTPIDDLQAAKQSLSELKNKIQQLLAQNPMATMQLAVAQKNIPTLINRCEAIITAKSSAPSSAMAKRDVGNIAAAIKAQASGAAPTPAVKKEETPASPSSIASKVQPLAVKLPTIPVSTVKKEETAVSQTSAESLSFEGNTIKGKNKHAAQSRFERSRFDTIRGWNAENKQNTLRQSQMNSFDTLKRMMSEAYKDRPTVFDVFTGVSSSQPASSLEQQAVSQSKPPAKPAPVPKSRTAATAETVQTTASSPLVEEPVTPAIITTEIIIKCKVPRGHTLSIRGDKEGGLDWNEGSPLEKVDWCTYKYCYEGSNVKSFQFQVFLDDKDDHGESEKRTMEIGKSQEFTPALALPYVPFLVHYKTESNDKLFIRGSGPGLSWEKGVELKEFEKGKWIFELPSGCDPFEFKLLLNDEQWEPGANHKTEPGKTLGFISHF